MSRPDTTDRITDAVVLAGGEGRRVRPLTENRPKPMLPAANRPILERVFDTLVEGKMTTIHVVVGYRQERVQGYFGSTYRGVPIRYYQQSKQLGSGHALQQAAGGVTEPFLAVNGDQLTEARMVEDVVAAHESNDSQATLGVIESEKASCYGSVTLDGSTVTTLIERPEEPDYRLLNAGVYGFDETIFAAIERTAFDGGVLDLPAVLSELIDHRGSVAGVRTEGYWLDATYPWDLLTVARRLLSESVVGDGISEAATVHETAVVRSPSVVSAECEVGPGAVVGPYTALGRNATVDANAVVSESVVGEDTRIGPNSTVERTVTGQGVHFGPACVVPAGRTDVCIDETVHTDQLLGAVVADRVDVVGDAGFAPGTLVGPNATVGLGASVDGTVDGGTEVVR